MKDDRLYLIHMQECMERVLKYTIDGRDKFMESTLIQDATIRNLQIMAESSQRISEELKTTYPEIDWRNLSGFRNVLVGLAPVWWRVNKRHFQDKWLAS